MCLTFFCSHPKTDPRIKFIIGFNREQQTQRETLPLGNFSQDENIIGGRDLKSGGTWLGVNIRTGLLVFLTNYDLFPPGTVRWGKSRGQLVHRLLSSTFLPPNISPKQADVIVSAQLEAVGRQGKEYTPFNLTVHNILSGNSFYICSQWPPEKNPLLLNCGTPYGICNCDILTLWPKTAHGMTMFQQLLPNLPNLSSQDIFQSLRTIFRDKKRFSEIDDDESSIFVQPYWCTLESAERMTKSTFMMLIIQTQGKMELQIKQITYNRKDNTQSQQSLYLTL